MWWKMMKSFLQNEFVSKNSWHKGLDAKPRWEMRSSRHAIL